jgi:hypothetical protein
MKRKPPTDPSRLRQDLLCAEQQRAQHLEAILDERGPIIRGSYVAQPGRCGKSTCKCARGEFHAAGALYRREQGRPVCTYVPVADRHRVEQLASRYKRVRQARASLAKVGRKSLELTDTLLNALTEPYPPDGGSKAKTGGARVRRRRKEPSS